MELVLNEEWLARMEEMSPACHPVLPEVFAPGYPINPTLLHPALPVQAVLGGFPPGAGGAPVGAAPKGRLNFLSAVPWPML